MCRQQRKQGPVEEQGVGRFGRTLSGAFAAAQRNSAKLGDAQIMNDPMESGTPDASSAAPRMYTQDSYKEDNGEHSHSFNFHTS